MSAFPSSESYCSERSTVLSAWSTEVLGALGSIAAKLEKVYQLFLGFSLSVLLTHESAAYSIRRIAALRTNLTVAT